MSNAPDNASANTTAAGALDPEQTAAGPAVNGHGPTSPCPENRSASSIPSVLAVFGCFALFLLLVSLAYLPKKPGKERGPYDEDGIRTPAERLEKLAELRANEAAAAHSYAWLDQSAGQVQLPIERAMELIVQRYSAKPAARAAAQN